MIGNNKMKNKENEALHMDCKDIVKILEADGITTVSFDIFDTLLVRPSIQPKDIFYLLQDKIKREYGLDFIELRYNAENELGKKNATLEEIWSYIASSHHIDSGTATRLMQEEIELEVSMLSVRSDIKEIYDCAVTLGKKIIVISDMYLPSDVLKRALDKNGYTKIERIYVSCEHHCRKDEGKLYDFVLGQEPIEDPSKLLHIGDNFWSDFKVPLKKGILAIHYPGIWDVVWENTPWGSILQDQNFSDDPYMRILYSYSFLYLYNTDRSRAVNKKVFGDLEGFAILFLAQLLVAVSADIYNNEEIARTYSRVCFAARDGYLPQVIYDIISQGQKRLPSEYLFVSRQALSFCTYKDFFDYFDHNEWGYNAYCLSNFIDYYLLDADLKRHILDSLSEEEKALDLHNNQLACRRVLLRYKKEFDGYFTEQRMKSREYYNSVFAGNSGRELVFDCGYSGSVSYGLNHACGKTKKFDKFYLWETSKNRSRDKKEGTKTFCFFEEETAPGICIILEECFSPLQESCVGFEASGNGVKPVVKEIAPDAQMERDMLRIKSICVEYAEEFMWLFREYIGSFNVQDRELFIKMGYQGFLFSPYIELDMFRHIRFTDPSVGGIPLSLSSKIYNIFDAYKCYVTPFDGTSFRNPESILDHRKEKEGLVTKPPFKIGMHLHLYNDFIYEEIFYYLKNFPYAFDLYVTITDGHMENILKSVFIKRTIRNLNEMKVIIVPNRGRDVAPWLLYTKEQQKEYDYFCHIHAKVSQQYSNGFGDRWRKYLFDNLLKREAVIDIIGAFEEREKLGCVFPQFFKELASICTDNSIPLMGVDGESSIINDLLSKLELKEEFDRSDMLWSAGTMLWYRTEALKPLFDLDLKIEDYPEEPVGVGGTVMHAIERMVSVIPKSRGFYTKLYNIEGSTGIDCYSPMSRTVDIGVRGALHNWLYKHCKPKFAGFLCRMFRLY